MNEQQASREERFVAFVLDRSREDAGFAARLRRADNPDTEYQSWDILTSFGVSLERDAERLPFALVGAALCRFKPERDGVASLGEALRSCFEDEDNGAVANQGGARLRRLLACDSSEEACRIVRPMLALIAARTKKTLGFARLLNELLRFGGPFRERIKLRWAQDFYSGRKDFGEDSEADETTRVGDAS